MRQMIRDYNADAPLGRFRVLSNRPGARKNGTDAFGRTVFPDYVIDALEDFYVGQVVPVIHYTMGGIAIDVDSEATQEQVALLSRKGRD